MRLPRFGAAYAVSLDGWSGCRELGLSSHDVDAAGQVVIRRQLKRRFVLFFFENLPACLVGMEACASSHYWSRQLQALGHMVRLMPPAYVKASVKRQKNDTTDAVTFCRAVTRPNMRFVPKKTVEQQSCPMLHRARPLFIRQQTAVIKFNPGLSCRIRDCCSGRAPGCRAIAGGRRRCDRQLPIVARASLELSVVSRGR